MNVRQKLYLVAALAAAATVPASIGISVAAGSRAERQALSLKAQLGRAIFFDTALSEPAGQSCASCHDASRAFADPDKNAVTSRGAIPPLIGNRNAPTSMYASFSPKFHWDEKEEMYLGGQFWDGRAATLEEQAKGPFVNPLEMANPHGKAVVEKVRRSAYAPMFAQVYGPGALNDDEKAYERVAEALAEFQRTPQFAPFTSKYDAYLAGKARLTRQEMRGLRLFEAEDKGNCAACHPSRPGPKGEPPLFTDFSYDNLGIPRNPDNPFYRLPAKYNPAGERFVDRGLGGALGKASEDGKFKVPTLRNIAITGPYTHNGYFRTLEGLTAFYNDRDVRQQCGSNLVGEADALRRKCWPAPEVEANINEDELGDLKLSQGEIEDIVAFMKTLTDGWRPGK
jgi:cytochrome c peroxidase